MITITLVAIISIVAALEIAMVAPALQAVQAVSSSGCEHASPGIPSNNGGGFNPHCRGEAPPIPNCNSGQSPCRIRPFS